MDRLEYLSAAEIGKLVNSKQISPTEVIDYFAARIQKRNPSINAFVYERFEYAIFYAKEIEKRILSGENAGPFAAVPFAMKDFLPSKAGWQNSHGGVRSLIATDPYDSRFTYAMEKAGGIAIGKTNAPAFGFRGTCDNFLYGPTSTPFNTDYNSGGSSGGSAAAVADGLVPVAQGTDGGGSIRIPAAWCSCFGLKPSKGIVPDVSRPDAWAATHPYCSDGGITKTVEDSAILLSFMANYDTRDPISINSGTKDYTVFLDRSIKGMKIGFTPDFGIFPVDREVKETVEKAALCLRDAGATVEPMDFKINRTANELAEMWCRSICVDTAIDLTLQKENGFDLIKDHSDELPKEFIYWNEAVQKGGIMNYYEFNRSRTDILDAFENAFEKYDIIISPTTVCLPVKNEKDGDTKGPDTVNGVKCERLIGFCETFMQNFSGHPAASVPAGLSQSGLPIGMQITGKMFRDGDVISVSSAFEKLKPWHEFYNIPFSRKI